MTAEYTYRRKLRANDLVPALAAGFGLALAGFYFARILLQRTPVVPRSGTGGALTRRRPPQPPATLPRRG